MKKKVLVLMAVAVLTLTGITVKADYESPSLDNGNEMYSSMAHCGSSFTMKICCYHTQTAVKCSKYTCVCY